jgi:hypothetical protein
VAKVEARGFFFWGGGPSRKGVGPTIMYRRVTLHERSKALARRVTSRSESLDDQFGCQSPRATEVVTEPRTLGPWRTARELVVSRGGCDKLSVLVEGCFRSQQTPWHCADSCNRPGRVFGENICQTSATKISQLAEAGRESR